uniref:TIR domain-containing protein n=1 Tax=Knipowitschia caucasica TaxID=637954 RepID=A0AAV2J3V5_KNICA
MLGWITTFFKAKSSKVDKDENISSSSSQAASSPAAVCSQHQSLLDSAVRWSRPYDVFVCHSCEPGDTEEAERLVSFLEAPSRNLRCYLSHRDSSPGAAIPTELYQAVHNSHIKVLLVSQHFLSDGWCTYVMHQAMVDGPMSNRLIPLVRNLMHSDVPPELKVYSYCDLSRNTELCFALVYRTVLQYLKDLLALDEKKIKVEKEPG